MTANETIIVLIPGAGAIGNRHSLPGLKRDYFKEFKQVLTTLDVPFSEVYGDVNGRDGVNERVYQLQKLIGRIGGSKNLILIGHSMGGLAARLAMRERHLRKLVRGILTFNTPHLGTEMTDIVLGGGKFSHIAQKTLSLVFGNIKGVKWLTDLSTENAKNYNLAIDHESDIPPVLSIISGQKRFKMYAQNPVLGMLGDVLNKNITGHTDKWEIANDGVVATYSQYWGIPIAQADFNHGTSTGLGATPWEQRRVVTFYHSIIGQLQSLGYIQ